jgi:hypothetical protein
VSHARIRIKFKRNCVACCLLPLLPLVPHSPWYPTTPGTHSPYRSLASPNHVNLKDSPQQDLDGTHLNHSHNRNLAPPHLVHLHLVSQPHNLRLVHLNQLLNHHLAPRRLAQRSFRVALHPTSRLSFCNPREQNRDLWSERSGSRPLIPFLPRYPLCPNSSTRVSDSLTTHHI